MNKAAFEKWWAKPRYEDVGKIHRIPTTNEIWQYFNQDAPNPGTNEPKVGTVPVSAGKCPTCGGSGEKFGSYLCDTCDGSGEQNDYRPGGEGEQPCPDCTELDVVDRRKGERRQNFKYAERRLKTWGHIDAILVDKSYSVGDCVDGNYSVVSKIIQVIAKDTGEPMTSPEDIPLYMFDHRIKNRRSILTGSLKATRPQDEKLG